MKMRATIKCIFYITKSEMGCELHSPAWQSDTITPHPDLHIFTPHFTNGHITSCLVAELWLWILKWICKALRMLQKTSSVGFMKMHSVTSDLNAVHKRSRWIFWPTHCLPLTALNFPLSLSVSNCCLFLVSPPSCQPVKLGKHKAAVSCTQCTFCIFNNQFTHFMKPGCDKLINIGRSSFQWADCILFFCPTPGLDWGVLVFFLFFNNTMTAVHVHVEASQPTSPSSHHGSATSCPGIFEAKASQSTNLLVWVTSSVKKALAKRLYNSYN